MAKEVNTEEILQKVSELHELYKTMNQQLLVNQEISVAAVKLIDIIAEEERTLKQITEKSGLDKSTISRQVNSLVRNDLVMKNTGKDKRYSYFTLTEKAKEKSEKYHEAFAQTFKSTLEGWTEEEKQMLSVLLGRLNRSINNGLK